MQLFKSLWEYLKGGKVNVTVNSFKWQGPEVSGWDLLGCWQCCCQFWCVFCLAAVKVNQLVFRCKWCLFGLCNDCSDLSVCKKWREAGLKVRNIQQGWSFMSSQEFSGASKPPFFFFFFTYSSSNPAIWDVLWHVWSDGVCYARHYTCVSMPTQK